MKRAQPWLGTLVSVRVDDVEERDAHAAIELALREVATVHEVMSFHSATSDVSRINRAEAGEDVEVHPYTHEVLRHALRLSRATQGCFDVTVGAELVQWRLLPASGRAAGALGTWRDIELLPGNAVRLRERVCVDLGGIAKGYAVDRAVMSLRESGVVNAVVNAGGDIRVLGEKPEQIRLGVGGTAAGSPVLELADGSVASSGGVMQRMAAGRGPHVDGRSRGPAMAGRFACVVAEDCVMADALTKVVMADGRRSAPLLQCFHASAYLHDPREGWWALETEGDGCG